MSESPSEQKEERICSCSGTTVRQIEQLIGKGVCDLENLSRITGACSGCGACDSDILALLAEHAARERTSPLPWGEGEDCQQDS